MIVYNIRRLLDQDKAKKDTVPRKIGTPSTYQELLTIAQKGGASGGFKGDIVEVFGDPSGSSSQLKASTIDRSKVPVTTVASSTSSGSKKSGPKKKAPHESKLNAVALLILFLPVVLYYAVDR